MRWKKQQSYFYSGESQIVNGSSIAFDGIYNTKSTPVEAHRQIRKLKEREFGIKVIFKSFNKI